jgi:undecaprenyl-diphosphatase
MESFILGTIQGIAEWLPVSSEGLIFLVKSNFFNNNESILEIARLGLFLHFGTFLAALVFFQERSFLFNKKSFSMEEY